MAKTLLVTGSSGLIGSEVCSYFSRELGYTVHGVDNNQRAVFFGPQGDTRWNQSRLAQELKGFVHHELDIRDRAGVLALVKSVKPSVIVHTAAQPSHDRAAALKDALPFKRGFVGYISDIDIPNVEYDRQNLVGEFTLTQFSLAPIVLIQGSDDEEWNILSLSQQAYEIWSAENAAQYEVIKFGGKFYLAHKVIP